MASRQRFRKNTELVRKTKPTPADAHVNTPLTNISVAYIQQATWASREVFPEVPVQKQSDVFYLFNRDDFLRDEARPRAPGQESAGAGFGLSTASYSCLVEAFHKDIEDQLRENADSVLQLDRAATEFVTQKLMIRRERRWMTSFFTTGVWGTDITGVNSAPSAGQNLRWNVTGSDPRLDVDTAKLSIKQKTGMSANVLIIGAEVMPVLRRHADVRDQFKYTSAESIDEVMLARFFGIDRIVVADAIFVNAIEGATTAPSFIAGKNALLAYVADAPSLMTPTAGYTFVWSGMSGSVNGARMKRLRADLLGSDRIEGEMATDFKVVAADCGYFFSTVIA